MTHEWTEEEGLVITLGWEAFAQVKALLAKKQYRYEMTDTEIKLKSGVIRRPDVSDDA